MAEATASAKGTRPEGAVTEAEASTKVREMFTQIAPRHIRGLSDFQQSEHRRRHVFQRASLAKLYPERILVVLELSGAEASINLGLAVARSGATVSLLGIPKTKSVTIQDYTGCLIFKGLTLHAVIGRRIFETWIKMLDLLRAGLDVEDIVTNEFEGLESFHDAMALLESRRAMKVVFYPNGRP